MERTHGKELWGPPGAENSGWLAVSQKAGASPQSYNHKYLILPAGTSLEEQPKLHKRLQLGGRLVRN
jgi:hypothetical protein